VDDPIRHLDPEWDFTPAALREADGKKVHVMGTDPITGEPVVAEGVLVVLPGMFGDAPRLEDGPDAA
jgi:hypothetical protein